MRTAKATISIITCKVVGHIHWNGFINNFMKEIHIIENKGSILNCLHFLI